MITVGVGVSVGVEAAHEDEGATTRLGKLQAKVSRMKINNGVLFFFTYFPFSILSRQFEPISDVS
jgi:hypothetical protein